MQPHAYWQEILPPSSLPTAPPFGGTYPALLPDGRQLALPIRTLANSSGLASLIINQASFAVQRALSESLAERLAAVATDVIVGLPTLGLAVAAAVAEALGHSRYVPCGTSRKFWYDDALSTPMSSVTTSAERRLYLDPRLLPLLANRRVALVDDVLSTGSSIVAGLDLLRRAGIAPVAIAALMLQTDRWRTALPPDAPPVVAILTTPALQRSADGWYPG